MMKEFYFVVLVVFVGMGCGEKVEEKNKRAGAPAVVPNEVVQGPSPAAPAPAVVPNSGLTAVGGEDAPVAAEPLRRAFKAMPLSGLDDLPHAGLIAAAVPDGLIVTEPTGQGFAYAATAKTLTPRRLNIPAFETQAALAVTPTGGWILTTDMLAHAAMTAGGPMLELPVVKVPLVRLLGTRDLAKLEVIAAYPDEIVLLHERALFVIAVAAGALKAEEIALPASFVLPLLGAGRSDKVLWIAGATELQLFDRGKTEAHWQRLPLELDAGGEKLTGLALRLASGADGYTLEGPVYAVSEKGLLWSETGEATLATGGKRTSYNWSLDARSRADQFCAQCHVDLGTEDGWWAKKDEILRRIAAATKGEGFAMPPPATVPAKGMSDADRALLVAWLGQGRRAATETDKGDAGGMSGGGPSQAFTQNIRPIAERRCANCHGASLTEAFWVAGGRAQAITRELSARTMPPAGSAAATAMTETERQTLLQFVGP